MSFCINIKENIDECSSKNIQIRVINNTNPQSYNNIVVLCPTTYKIICPYGMKCTIIGCLKIHPFTHNTLLCPHNNDINHNTETCGYVHNVDFAKVFFWYSLKNSINLHNNQCIISSFDFVNAQNKISGINNIFMWTANLKESYDILRNIINMCYNTSTSTSTSNYMFIVSSDFSNIITNHQDISKKIHNMWVCIENYIYEFCNFHKINLIHENINHEEQLTMQTFHVYNTIYNFIMDAANDIANSLDDNYGFNNIYAKMLTDELIENYKKLLNYTCSIIKLVIEVLPELITVNAFPKYLDIKCTHYANKTSSSQTEIHDEYFVSAFNSLSINSEK